VSRDGMTWDWPPELVAAIAELDRIIIKVPADRVPTFEQMCQGGSPDELDH
jgi:hypothetical protein